MTLERIELEALSYLKNLAQQTCRVRNCRPMFELLSIRVKALNECNFDIVDKGDSVYYGQILPLRIEHGYGMKIGKEGTLWEGHYVNGELDGIGRRISNDGEVYCGLFYNG